MTEKKSKCFWWSLLTATFHEWSEDKALRFSAALAYYSVFSIAPLLIIAIAVAGFAFGEKAARGEVVQQLANLIGADPARELQSLIEASGNKPKSALATVVGVLALVVGACGVFGQLKDALNTIWGVRIRSGSVVREFLHEYVMSFGMVLGVGFLLVVSLLFTTTAQMLGQYMSGFLSLPAFAAPLGEILSFALMTVLFGLIYKVLPDVELTWKEVRIGAFVTATFFTLGKLLIGLYLARSSVASSFGAAGALILVLVWIYYSATIFFFGAEFTKVYARECGCGIVPSARAVLVTKDERNEQGLVHHDKGK